MNFKTKDQKFLRTLLIFTPILLVPKKCGLLISLYEFVQERIRECPTLTYIIFHFEINLMDLVIQDVRPNYFSKKSLKYIFKKLDFINI